MIPTKSQTDREKILAWLKRIEEFDPAQIAFVVGECSTDPEARAYYLKCAELRGVE